MDKLNIGDRVITSRGRFGRIEEISSDKAKVIIGKNLIELQLNELISVKGVKAIEVEYHKSHYDRGIVSIEKDIVFISSRIIVFDYNSPMDNNILTECKNYLKKKHELNDILILKLRMV